MDNWYSNYQLHCKNRCRKWSDGFRSKFVEDGLCEDNVVADDGVCADVVAAVADYDE